MKKKNILGLCAKHYSCKRCPRYSKCTEELEKESKKRKEVIIHEQSTNKILS